jgi:energy-coupling factor transporter ATP-binding protein EcfA2
MTSTLVPATVAYIGQPKENQWGKTVVSVKVKTSAGEEIWINYRPGDAMLIQLSKGQSVMVVPAGSSTNGKPKYTLVLNGIFPQSTGEIEPATKQAIAAHCDDVLSLWCRNYVRVQEIATERGIALSPEDIRSAVGTATIHALRHFC